MYRCKVLLILVVTVIGNVTAKGGWSSWSEWSGWGKGLCSGDHRVKTRTCTNPLPDVTKGEFCDGENAIFEEGPVDGGFSEWSQWSTCDTPCGGAAVNRTRQCNNPPPRNNGAYCKGNPIEIKLECITPCPDGRTDGGWSPWSAWSSCPSQCSRVGGGFLVKRYRQCNMPSPMFGGSQCLGNSTEEMISCFDSCPIHGGFGQWSEFTECSKSCGSGVKSRSRFCNNPEPRGVNAKNCTGKFRETKYCKLAICIGAIDGQWSSWQRWSQCTEQKTCNFGTTKRKRLCNNPAPSHGGDQCQGTDEEIKVCPTENCQVFRPKAPATLPVNKEDYIYRECGTTMKYLASITTHVNVPNKIFQHLKHQKFRDGYFSFREEEKGKIVKYCFEPFPELTLKEAADLVPSFYKTDSIPSYIKPRNFNAPLLGFSIRVLKGSSFKVKGYDFGIERMNTYSPLGKMELHNVMMTYHSDGTNFGFLAKGEFRLFSPYNFDCVVFRNSSHYDDTFMTGSIPKLKLVGLIDSLKLPDDTGGGLGAMISALKNLGLWHTEFTPVTIGYDVRQYKPTFRLSATKIFNGVPLHFEAIYGKATIAIGFSFDGESFGAVIEKMAGASSAGKAVAKFFNTIGLQVEVGIALVPPFLKAIHVTKHTRFTKAPLNEMMEYEIPQGLTAGAQVSIPKDCKDSSFCKICKKLFGPKAKFRVAGTISKGYYKIAGDFYKVKITGNYRFEKLELFAEVNTTANKRSVGFKAVVNIPVNSGEVIVDGITQERSIKVGGELRHTIGKSDVTGTLFMKGMWYHAFGLSWLNMGNIILGMTITIGSPIPVTGFQFGGQLEFGKNCLYDADFANSGHCLRVQVYFGIGKPTYFYGRISALTIGKLIRMCGGNIALPKPVDVAGFPKGLLVQHNPSGEVVDLRPYGGPFISKGFILKGVLDLFGYQIKAHIKLSDEETLIDGELDPINLGGHLVVSRNSTARHVGPKLFFRFKKPTSKFFPVPFFNMYFEGYCKILGIESSTYINITMQAMEIFVYGKVWNLLYAELYISAGYDYKSIKDAHFYIRVRVDLRGLTDAIEKAKNAVDSALKYAQKRLNDAIDDVKEAKRKCKEKLKIKCSNCYNLKCKQATEDCKGFLNKAGKWIGGKINVAGRWIVGVGRKIGRGLARVGRKIKNWFRSWGRRRRRALLGVLSQEEYEIHLREKRFISKLICEGIVGGGCKGISHLCYGTCRAVDFIGQGLCHTLDIAVGALRLADKTLGWVNAAVKFILEMFLVHGIFFELGLGQQFNGFMVGAEIDLTLFGKRMYFGFQFDLKNPVRSILSAKDGAMYKYKAGVRQLRTGPTFDPYDQPNPFADFDLTGTFAIEASSTGTENRLGACVAISPNEKMILVGCNESDARQKWTYTLKGTLINLHTKKCLAFPNKENQEVYVIKCGEQTVLQKHECDVATRSLKLYRTRLCMSAVDYASANGPGSLTHHGSLKCIHLLPNNRLALKSGCKRLDIIFQLEKDGQLTHKASKKCVRPVNGNAAAGVQLELVDRKYGCHKFAFTSQGSIQHVDSRLCVQTVNKEMVPKENTKLILGHRCEHTHIHNKVGALADPQMTFTFVPYDNSLRMKECAEFIDGKYEQKFSVMYEELQSVCSKFSKDLALDKIASQSSIAHNGFPSRAVDGNYNYLFRKGSCMMTKEEKDPWWRVDLGREYIVTDVTIINRGDEYADRLQNIQVHVGQSLTVRANPTCHDRVRFAAAGEAVRLQCNPAIAGQFVGIQMYGKGTLSVCEVIVASRLDGFVDYCQIENGGCDQVCYNKCGREVMCGCLPGYKLAYDRRTCLDVDECRVNNGGCLVDGKTYCVNYPGGHHCRCSQGYILKDNSLTECVDLDECGSKNGGCEQMCDNKVGGYLCTCRKGYERKKNDPYGCQNINECLVNNGGCKHECVDYDGGYYCKCRPGYRLMDDKISCEEKYCAVLETPFYGLVEPSTCGRRFENIPVGTLCNFECSKGYEIRNRNIKDDTKQLSCRIDGTWDHDTPACYPVTCPILPRPENGGLIPARCHSNSNGVNEYGQRCVAYCKHGYRLRGPGTKYCQSNKKWSHDGAMVECIKVIEPPYLNCPNGVDLILPSHQDFTTLGSLWQPPQTNINDSFIESEPRLIGAAYQFYVGQTLVMYRASLSSGQMLSCSYMVTVMDDSPPRMKNCPSDIMKTSSNDRAIISWTEPTFTDNVGVEKVVKPHRKSGEIWENGESMTLQYVAVDTSGNEAVCSFKVSFKSDICSALKGNEVTLVQTNIHRRQYSVSCIGQRTLFGNFDPLGVVADCIKGDYYIDDVNIGLQTPACVGYIDTTANALCPEGFVKFSFEDLFVGTLSYYCAQCPAGMFYNTTSRQCYSCPLGTYQDEEGQTFCETCPKEYSTLNVASKNESQCLKLCQAGYFSASGFNLLKEPCSQCPKGSYSYLSGTKQCIPCPDNGITEHNGAVDVKECYVPLSITRVAPSNKITTEARRDTVIECYIKGTPKPKISWLKVNGKMPIVYEKQELTDLNFNLIGARLTIYSIRPSESGTYRCIIQNVFGKISQDIDISVITK